MQHLDLVLHQIDENVVKKFGSDRLHISFYRARNQAIVMKDNTYKIDVRFASSNRPETILGTQYYYIFLFMPSIDNMLQRLTFSLTGDRIE